MTAGFVIAVDGPAASGKGTVGAGLAAHYALPYLDTGLLYRAVGLAVRDPSDEAAAADAAPDHVLGDTSQRVIDSAADAVS